jgi:hypothetical protein
MPELLCHAPSEGLDYSYLVQVEGLKTFYPLMQTKVEANGSKRDELLKWILDAACNGQQTIP